MGGTGDRFATCPATQGALLRVHMRISTVGTAAAAWEALRAVSQRPHHEWWDEPLSYLDVPHRNLQGYKQITDAWLAELARRRGGRVATLDSGFATLHGDVAVLLPRLK